MRGGVHQRCGPVLCTPPYGWAYPAHTRGSFRFTTKGTKGVPGLRSWTPLGGHYHPPRGVAAPPERGETPGSTQKSNLTTAPRIDSGGCDPRCSSGRKKTDLPTNSKWQIGLLLWLKVARREPERSAASAKRAVRDGYSFQFNRACAPSLEPDCVRFPKFCWNPGGFQRAQPLARLW